MSLHGIRALACGNLDPEIVTFLEREGFVFDVRSWSKYIEISEYSNAWTVTVHGDHIDVISRYAGRDDQSFPFDVSDSTSFVRAYNAMVDVIGL